MATIIDGTVGATFPAGSAASPSITTTGNTSTGIYFPATDTIGFTEGGVESMRIDSSSRITIGSTPLTNSKLNINEGDVYIIRTGGQPKTTIVSSQAATYSPSLLSLTRTGAGLYATPNDSFIGRVSWDGLDTDTSFANFGAIEVQIGTNAAGGGPGTMNFMTSATGQFSSTRMSLTSSQLFISGNATALIAVPGSLGNSTVYSRIGMTVVNDTTTLGYFQTYNSNAATDLKTWRHGGQTDGSYVFQTVNDTYASSNIRLTVSSTGILSDSKGDVRAAPISGGAAKTGAYVLVAADAGQTIYTNSGVTINASILSAGDMVTVVNNSASAITITAGTSVTFRLAGTATTGNRTLAQYGMATFLCVVGGATPTLHCSGAGLT